MIRRLIAIVLLGIAASGGGSIVAAQDVATPATGFAESQQILSVDGSPLGTIQVTAVEDLYTLYDPTTPPAYGMRYVAVTMDIRSQGDRPWSFNPAHLVMVDDAGFALTGAGPRFVEGSRIALLTSQDIAPGATLTGSMVYQVALGSGLNRMVYTPANDRLVEIVRFDDGAPEIGTVTGVATSDGSVFTEITVTEAQNPFTGFEQNAPPARGSNYVLITVTVINPGPRPMRLDPNAFLLVDAEGFVVFPVTIRRGETPPTDLVHTDPFTVDSSATGGIGYLVLSGVDLDALVYAPSRDRLVEVANLNPNEG